MAASLVLDLPKGSHLRPIQALEHSFAPGHDLDDVRGILRRQLLGQEGHEEGEPGLVGHGTLGRASWHMPAMQNRRLECSFSLFLACRGRSC